MSLLTFAPAQIYLAVSFSMNALRLPLTPQSVRDSLRVLGVPRWGRVLFDTTIRPSASTAVMEATTSFCKPQGWVS